MMRRFYALLPLLVVLLIPTGTWAVNWNYKFTVNGIKYHQNGNEREIRMDLGGGAYNVVVVPEVVVDGLEDDSYTGELVIPDYVEYEIRNDMGEVYLKSPVVGITEEAFMGCKGLTSVIIGKFVEDIYYWAFKDCTNLESFTIPTSVEYIDEEVFVNTAWYNALPDGLIYKDNVLFGFKGSKAGFEGHLDIADGTRIIAGGALKYTMSISSVTIPNSVISICQSAFFQSGITSLIIPTSVKGIYYQAFHCCNKLEKIEVESGNLIYDSRSNCNAIIETEKNQLAFGCKNTIIPNSVTSIKEFAFRGHWMKSVVIPNSITSIGSYAFMDCWKLETIYSEIKEPFIVDRAFEDYDDKTLYVPAGTKTKYEATDGWKEFKNIVEMTPYDVLDDNTVAAHFLEPDEEGKVEIPETVEIDGKTYTVTEIAANAFKDNKELKEVTIPGTVTKIGDGAFAGCENLRAIYVYAPEPISLTAAEAHSMMTRAAENVPSQFEGIDFEACTLYVPIGSEQKYREAEGWKLFTHIVGVEAPSGITTIRTAQNANGAIYNLSGQRLATPKKGLNIIGSKKVVVR